MISEENFIIVNYHYIENPQPEWRGIHPCAPELFMRHLEFLARSFQFASIEEVCEAAESRRDKKLCAITFDDGLRDQWENAMPILKRYGAPAAFFPITKTWEGHMPAAHKMHVLLSRFSSEEIVSFFNVFIKKEDESAQIFYIPIDRRIHFSRRLHDDAITANLKETLANMPEHLKNVFLDECFRKTGLDEKMLAGQFFMSRDNIRALRDDGYTIGCHSHQHFALDTLDRETLRRDIRASKDFLKTALGKKPRIFSYPYGRYHTMVFDVLQEEGFVYALTTERRGVRRGDQPFVIPRFDANDVSELL